jgi:hypothetical protein
MDATAVESGPKKVAKGPKAPKSSAAPGTSADPD